MTDDLWLVAWYQLKTVIDAGATREEVTAYAQELSALLPQGPDTHGPRAQAIQHVITEILNGEDSP